MSVCEELDPMVEHRTQFAFKGKRDQHIDIEIPHSLRDHVIVPDIVKSTFNLDIDSREKTCSVVNNVGRALVKKKVLMLGSKDIDTINNSDVCGTYNDLYLSEKEHEEKLLQGIQSTNGLKLRVGAKKADRMALVVITQENTSKKSFDKRFVTPLGFDFFRHSVCPYGLKEDLIVRLELNSSESVILCTGNSSAT